VTASQQLVCSVRLRCPTAASSPCSRSRSTIVIVIVIAIVLSSISRRSRYCTTSRTHQKILQDVIPVLLLAPGLERLEDVLELIEHPLALGTESRGARSGSARGLERVRAEDDFEQLGDLLLRPGRVSGTERDHQSSRVDWTVSPLRAVHTAQGVHAVRSDPIHSQPKPERPAPRSTHGSFPASSAPNTSATLILSPLSGIMLSTSLLDGRDADTDGPFPLTVPESRGVRSDM
jgi:hypothetical protein